MRLIFHFLASVGANIVAFLLANRFIAGFVIIEKPYDLIFAAVALTLLNWLVRPVLKLIFGPVIVISLGLGIIIVNAIILYLLTQFTSSLTIGIPFPLLYATLLIGAVNLVMNFIAKRIV